MASDTTPDPRRAAASTRIVLVRTTHPGNLGAVARAMRNMGLERLYLVAPETAIGEQALVRAAGALDVLDNAVICASLDEALADCPLVIGTTARTRTVGWPALTPSEAMARAVAEAGRHQVAIVFGQERTGLSNDELDRCHCLVRIPVDDRFPSINLASAVMVLAYEWRCALAGGGGGPGVVRELRIRVPDEPLATAAEVRGMLEHLRRVIERAGFLAGQPGVRLFRRIRRLFARARPTRDEINILRGILSAVETSLSARDPGAAPETRQSEP